MSAHSYSRCWIHLIWGTLNREKLLNKAAAARVSCWLSQYADEQGVYMKINYVNADHVHALVDLPTSLSKAVFNGFSDATVLLSLIQNRAHIWCDGFDEPRRG